MSIYTVLLVLLVIAILGTLPLYGWSSNWGFGPSGLLGLVLVVLLILWFFGKVRL